MAKKSEHNYSYSLHIPSSFVPVCVVIRCLWMLLEASVLYVRGICQRKLCKKKVIFKCKNYN